MRTVTHKETGRGYGLTVTLTDGTSHACRITTRGEDELDAWIEDLNSVVAHHCPTTY